MTVVVSILRPSAVIMANDSAVTYDFEDHTEYDTGRKHYPYPGIGLVTTWGARDGNRVGEYLDSLKLTPREADVEALADAVRTYLTTSYRPSDMGLGDVGFHVGGFTRERQARLYHLFWNTRIAAQAGRDEAGYGFEKYVPPKEGTAFLYNGRNDLVQTVISAFFAQLQQRMPIRIKRSVPGYASLCNLILRFATEMTPQVGPPFLQHLLNPDNQIWTGVAESMMPAGEGPFLAPCAALGIDIAEGPDRGAP